MAKLVKCKDCGHEISKKAKSCPQCGAPQKKKTSGCAWIMLLFLGFIVIGAILGGRDDTPSTQQAQKSRPAPTATPKPVPTATPIPDPQLPTVVQFMAEYVPLQSKIQALKGIAENSQYGWFAVACTSAACGEKDGYLVAFRVKTSIGDVVPIWHVSQAISERHWVNGKASGYTPDLSQISVPDIGAIYNIFKGMPIALAIPVQVAQSSTPAPIASPVPTITPIPTKTPTPTAIPDTRNGRTKEERQAIFRAIVAAEDKGMKQAEQEYPFIELTKENADKYRDLEMKQTEKRMARMDELTEQYRQDALGKRQISDEEWRKIQVEALTEDWFTTLKLK